jgi:hypothetical protein
MLELRSGAERRRERFPVLHDFRLAVYEAGLDQGLQLLSAERNPFVAQQSVSDGEPGISHDEPIIPSADTGPGAPSIQRGGVSCRKWRTGTGATTL